MRNIYFIIFILVLITTITRVAENGDNNTQQSFNLYDDGQSGIITTNDTKASLVQKFGIESLSDESIWIDEGTIEVKVTRLFKDTNPLTIFWGEDQTVSRIVLDEVKSSWNIEGITCGASLKELTELNGKHFGFYGFGWDRGGLVNNWNNGELASKIPNTEIELGINWDEVERLNINPDKFMGDNVNLSSDNQHLDPLDLKVARIVLTFN